MKMQIAYLIMSVLTYIICKNLSLNVYVFLIIISITYSLIYVVIYIYIYKKSNGKEVVKNEN